MKLWLLEPIGNLKSGDNPWNPWYDKTFGFVIRAETEEQARNMANKNAGDENRGGFLGEKIANTTTPWLDPHYSTCTELQNDSESKIILYNHRAS
jgi:hypothetical protein